MMSEERVREEITKLENARNSLVTQLGQTEGAIAAMRAVLDYEPSAEED